MKLELKLIAPYLPYGLKCYNDVHKIQTMDCWSDFSTIKSGNHVHIQGVLNGTSIPILRPLSDLTKEIEHNEERFMPVQRLFQFAVNFGINKGIFEHMMNSILDGETLITELPYYLVQKLIEWHFDIFNLIPDRLAINKNTLK